MRLLVADSETALARIIRNRLKAAGHTVDLVHRLEDAKAAISTTAYDLIVMESGLRDGPVLNFLRHMRAGGAATAVLLTSAHAHVADRIAGLEAGADDYITKPYDFGELMARITAIHRRTSGRVEPERRFGRLRVLPGLRRVMAGNSPVKLTHREWAIIDKLSQRPGMTISRSQIEDAIYGFGEEVESNSIEAHISRMRAKLGRSAIATERGFGYRIGQI